MDIRNCLKKDHVEALATAQEMSETDSPERARSLFAALRVALTAHSRAEEKIVYNALKRQAHEELIEHVGKDLRGMMSWISEGGFDLDV